MKIDKSISKEIIEEMREKGLDDESIQRFLSLPYTVGAYLSRLELEPGMMTVEQVSEYLIKHLGEEKEKFNKAKVLRLIKSGEIRSEPKSSNKEGFRIHISTVEEFVKFRKVTLEEWRDRALKAEGRVATLEVMIKQLEDKLKNS